MWDVTACGSLFKPTTGKIFVGTACAGELTGERLLTRNLVLRSRPRLECQIERQAGLVQDDVRAVDLNLHGSAGIRVGTAIHLDQLGSDNCCAYMTHM